MNDSCYIGYDELKSLKKGTVIALRDRKDGRQWTLGTFHGHYRSLGSDAMGIHYHNDPREDAIITVYTGLQFIEEAWKETQSQAYRWSTDEELGEKLNEQMTFESTMN